MRHTLKAVFDDRDKAQHALDTLLDSGYARADTDLASIADTPSIPAGDASAPGSPERHVLTVSTDSEQEAARAASLMAGCMHLSSEDAVTGVAASRAGMAPARYRRVAGPGALQFHARDVNHYFGTHDPNDISTIGTTFREPMLPEGHWPSLSAEDAALQEGNTGQREVDAARLAAYRFGHDMHEDERYRNRSWHESDADLKLLWAASDPARPGWDAAAPAIRLGWDSTSPEIDEDSYHRSHWRTNYAASAQEHGTNQRPAASGSAAPRRHPGQLTAWENFMDALRHGWNSITIGQDMDETDYRRHHALTYPGTNYDDFAPVYRYGHHVHRRTMFVGRSWDEVEGELQVEWERGHREGKPATWDELKAALHAGWDRS
jgi:hypothetical protein